MKEEKERPERDRLMGKREAKRDAERDGKFRKERNGWEV